MKICLAADHRGFECKKKLLVLLNQQGHQIIDCGNTQLDPEDDYPDFVAKLARQMLIDPESLGIVLCGNGVGVSLAANRYSYLRCGLGFSEKQVKKARQDDNINVLAIPADYLTMEQINQIVNIYLDTPFSDLERHQRRLAKINDYSRNT